MQYFVLQPRITNIGDRMFKLTMDASIIFINYYYTIRHIKTNGGKGDTAKNTLCHR